MSADGTPCLSGFVSAFGVLESRLPGANVPWLRRSRREALERFAAAGLPTTRDEDWKYTSVAAIARRPFEIDPRPGVTQAVAAFVEQHALGDAHRLVFADGFFRAELSNFARLPSGVRVGSLRAAIEAGRDVAESFFVSGAEGLDGFSELNLALWGDGAWVQFAPGASADEPLHLLFIATRPGGAILTRNIVEVGAGASGAVIEHHVGVDQADYLTATTTHVVLEPGARLSHAKLQQEGQRSFHIANVLAEQGRDSAFVSHAFAFGGQLSRAQITARLDAEGCDARLSGLYVGRGRQHMDHHTCIDHRQPQGTSRELYKGVLDESARAVFNGRVVVRPGARRTDALQANRNLLLSERAEVDTKPQLEIWADDVKCAHGATVGQLDADQLHYLRSRGIGQDEARALLIRAFAADTLAGIAHRPLLERLRSLLPGALEAGESCHA